MNRILVNLAVRPVLARTALVAVALILAACGNPSGKPAY
jgi:hypothetical protein